INLRNFRPPDLEEIRTSPNPSRGAEKECSPGQASGSERCPGLISRSLPAAERRQILSPLRGSQHEKLNPGQRSLPLACPGLHSFAAPRLEFGLILISSRSGDLKLRCLNPRIDWGVPDSAHSFER